MTKIYEGAGVYTVFFSTGKTLELTEDEMNEMAADAGIVEELEEEMRDHIATANMYASTISKIRDLMDDLDERI